MYMIVIWLVKSEDVKKYNTFEIEVLESFVIANILK